MTLPNPLEPAPLPKKKGGNSFRLTPAEQATLDGFVARLIAQDARKVPLSVLVRAILLPVLKRADRILALPMPPGATLRQRVERVLDKGLSDD